MDAEERLDSHLTEKCDEWWDVGRMLGRAAPLSGASCGCSRRPWFLFPDSGRAGLSRGRYAGTSRAPCRQNLKEHRSLRRSSSAAPLCLAVRACMSCGCSRYELNLSIKH